MICCYQNLKIGAMITISWKISSIQNSTFSCFLNAAKRNELQKCVKAGVPVQNFKAVRKAVLENVELR
jgi:CRISPR/Cas system-associated endoribonuclease Cas2